VGKIYSLGLVLLGLVACGGGAGEGAAGSLAGSIRSLTEPLKPNSFISLAPELGGKFGVSAAFAGNYVVFGAPGEDNDSGIVYVFDPVDGEAMELLPPGPIPGAEFGAAVAANAIVAVVGAPGDESAWVFDVNDGSLMLTFRSSRPQDGGFGWAVAASAANFIVGAPGESVIGGQPDDPSTLNAAGRAYYFDCVTDAVLQEFESPNAQTFGQFGFSVATIDFDVFIGAPGEVGGEGRVYHFDGLTGELLRTFVSPTAEEFGEFGGSIAVVRNGNGTTYLMVGAPNEANPLGQRGNDGRAHLFNVDTGALVISFDTPNAFQGGLFGARVASNGTVFAVAAPNEGEVESTFQEGFVYLFDVDAELLDVLASPNGNDFSHFGLGLAIGAEDILVGAPDEFLEGGSELDGEGRGYLNPPSFQEPQ